jgi:hypothetical protein
MQEKKLNQTNDYGTITIGGLSDYTTTYSNNLGQTLTIDPSSWSTGSTTVPYTFTSDYSTVSAYSGSSAVEITTDGVNIKQDGDLKIGDRSMKDFMDKVEDQLAILRPAPELEEKWDKLKELRRQYEECKQDILEKEKIMKILKEK